MNLRDCLLACLSARGAGSHSLASVLFCILMMLAADTAWAHVCGSTSHVPIVGRPFRFRIFADVFESQPSDYSVLDAGDPAIARIVSPPAFSSLSFGSWGILPVDEGTTTMRFFWQYTPQSASGFCDFVIKPFYLDASNPAPATKQNYLEALALGDPVSTLNGEFYLREDPDLDLGGPLPLLFQRFYGSNLINDLAGSGLIDGQQLGP